MKTLFRGCWLYEDQINHIYYLESKYKPKVVSRLPADLRKWFQLIRDKEYFWRVYSDSDGVESVFSSIIRYHVKSSQNKKKNIYAR